MLKKTDPSFLNSSDDDTNNKAEHIHDSSFS